MEWRPTERSVHGGADEIPLPTVAGTLWLCGKHFVGPDPEAALRTTATTTVVCLTERHELHDRYPAYVRWLETETAAETAAETDADAQTGTVTRAAGRARWFPMPDLDAPALGAAVALLDELTARLVAGDGLLLHCGAGIGRAGTIAAGLLIELGLDLETAVALVAAHRPMAGPEAGAQRDLLDELATRRRRR